jgi:hypothetical protein
MGYIQMLWNPDMQVEQPFDDSDIAHGNTRILNIPTDMDKSWVTALDAPSVIGLIAMAAVVGGIVTAAVKRS